MKTVVYEGPGEYHAFKHHVYGYWEFPVGVPVEVPLPVFEYVMSLNPWDATLDNASDYGAKIYREADQAAGGD